MFGTFYVRLYSNARKKYLPARQAQTGSPRCRAVALTLAKQTVNTSREFDQGAIVSLWSEFLNHKGRPIHKWLHDFTAYERHSRAT